MDDWEEARIDITPDDRIFTPRGVGALNIGVVECLSELTANSIDWRRFSKKEIETKKQEINGLGQKGKKFLDNYGFLLNAEPIEPVVKVILCSDSIQILDNGIGMTLEDIEIGLRLRAADDTKREPLRVRKGMFGMGMKVGILGLGWKMTIHTRSLLEKNKEHALQIDTRKIEKGNLKLKDIKVNYGPHLKESPLGEWKSGTSILIEDLHKKKHDPITFREHLGLAFAPEIEYGGVKIIVIDSTGSKPFELDPCEPKREPILEETKVILDDKDLYVKSDNGDGSRGELVKIRGWIALRETSGSGSGRWGLHTFRFGQLVEAFHNDGPALNGLLPKNPHPEFARLHGEIHLDMCDPNFTKVGWNTELLSWRDAQEILKPFLDQHMEASRKYRKKTGGTEAVRLTQKFKTAVDSTKFQMTDEGEKEPNNFLDDFKIKNDENVIKLHDGCILKISVTHQDLTKFSEIDPFWRYSYRKESNELAIFVNTDSILWNYSLKHSGDESVADLIVIWAIADSLYFCLVNDFKYSVNDALIQRNSLLKRLFNEKSGV